MSKEFFDDHATQHCRGREFVAFASLKKDLHSKIAQFIYKHQLGNINLACLHLFSYYELEDILYDFEVLACVPYALESYFQSKKCVLVMDWVE